MKTNFTDITFVLDKSGSMLLIKEATMHGFNTFLEDQKKVPGEGCFSMVQFDDQYENTYTAIPEAEVPPLRHYNFQPRGSTALIDAVCRVIDETGARLSKLPEWNRPGKVLIVIITDGQENSSRKYTLHDLNTRINHQREKYNWQFVYLGANQDAIAEAAKMGINVKSAMTYDYNDVGTKGMYCALSSSTRSYKADGNNTAAEFIIDPVPDVNISVTAKVST